MLPIEQRNIVKSRTITGSKTIISAIIKTSNTGTVVNRNKLNSGKTKIYPIFLPGAGCIGTCLFCNPEILAGGAVSCSVSELVTNISSLLDCLNNQFEVGDTLEIAFYGGNFTGLPVSDQVSILKPFTRHGIQRLVSGIRISCRPDTCHYENMKSLHDLGVTTVELGIQSLSNNVLKNCLRKYSVQQVVECVHMLQTMGFEVGLQFMVGLPGENNDDLNETITKTVDLKPDFVRIHPTLVLKNTLLEKWTREGKYQPLNMENAIEKCVRFLMAMNASNIPVSRLGLHPNPELNKKNNVVAGPFHPAFRQLVENQICLEIMLILVLKVNLKKVKCLQFHVPPGQLSNFIGQKKVNIKKLRSRYPGQNVSIVPDPQIISQNVVLETWE